jgi:DNA polymerase
MDPRLRKIVMQHAETSRLLGVDFVPVYSQAGSDLAPADAAETDEVSLQSEVTTSSPNASVLRAESATVQARIDYQQPAPSRAAVFRASIDEAANRAAAKPVVSKQSDAAPAIFPDEPSGPVRAPEGVPGGKPTDRAASQALLDELRAEYEKAAPHKPFITTYNKIVFGEGDPCSRIMFIGEAPGEDEDRTGRPFVGRAGQLLEKMIVAMGLSREQVYIANVMKVRPPGNATPTPQEAAASAPFLYKQISIVKPDVIVTLGLPASRTILNSDDSMAALRGTWWAFRDRHAAAGRIIPVMPTYHPAYVLRSYTPEVRGKVWSDLVQVLGRLGLELPKAGGKAVNPDSPG